MKAKKSFGQHFLINEGIASMIADQLTGFPENFIRVLEIGPGRGMLTKYLLKKKYELFACEADKDMVGYLLRHYPGLEKKLIEGDFLKIPLRECFGDQPIAIIGNFPYNISSQIIFKMIEYRSMIPQLVGMFQKEVAIRIISPEGSKNYGVTSVLSQLFYKGEVLLEVDRKAFAPPPKVQSAVIRLTRRPHPLIKDDEYSLLRTIVKQAFSLRRKMLRNSLKPFLHSGVILDDELLRKRPEQISVEGFICIMRALEP